MIPIQLTIQGLYSYQEKQIIDFTQLTAANLFGIFGTVGSGKSSILEAITFAIYGKTDRLNLSGDNRYYNMMNLKSNELLIDFIFETGKEQNSYRVIVKGKRNSKKFEDVKALDRSAYLKTGNEWIPVELSVPEQAIGLSYDNFKRTIIIPQGQFQEFLQLGNKDRTQMMKELFNLGKFEFYYKVTSLESKNNAQKQNIEGQLQQLGIVDSEQIGAYSTQLEKLESDLKAENKKLSELQQAEEQFRKLQELMKKKSEAEKERKNLLEQKEGILLLETKIGRYEKCVSGFKYLLEALQENIKKCNERKTQINSDVEKLKTEELEISRLDKSLQELKPAYEKREILKKKAEELTLLLKMKELEVVIEKEDVRLKKGTKISEETVLLLEKNKKEKEELETSIKADRNNIPDLALLSVVKTWYTEKHNFDKYLDQIQKEIEKYAREGKQINQEIDDILCNPVFNKLPKEAVLDDCIQHLKKETIALKEKQKELTAQENHWRVKEQLKTYANNLEEGSPCPLCGSLHHPDLFQAADVNDALKKLNAEQQHLEQQLEQIVEMENQLKLLNKQGKINRHNQKELGERLNKEQEKIAEHARQFVWDKYREEEELGNAFQDARLLQEKVKKQEAVLEELIQKILLQERNKERYLGEVDKIKTSLTVHKTELKTVAGQLHVIHPEQYFESSVDAIESEKNDLINEYNRIEKVFTETLDALQQRSKQKDTLSGRLEANQQQLKQDKQSIETIQKQVTEQLDKSAFESLEEVRRILSEPMEVENEKQKVINFKEHLLRSESLLEQIQKEVGERIYEAEAHQKLMAELSSLKDLISQKNQEQGKITELLKKLQNDLKTQTLLRKGLEQLELRAENIKTMKSLFKASGFVNYISSVYLQNLCNAANDRFFQLTRQKLSLEITPDNNFQVRDFMNGGKVRSVKTLSGGQTFQAALSLALALADNIQKITESNQNFFFLDEGFGSLDKESLNVVFDTLKSLQKENRIVGVISHVEEMQQEIDVHLRIESTDEKGSIIYPSWH